MPGTPGNAHSANLSFPKAEAADWAALIGKTVVIEITEVVG